MNFDDSFFFLFRLDESITNTPNNYNASIQ